MLLFTPTTDTACLVFSLIYRERALFRSLSGVQNYLKMWFFLSFIKSNILIKIFIHVLHSGNVSW